MISVAGHSPTGARAASALPGVLEPGYPSRSGIKISIYPPTPHAAGGSASEEKLSAARGKKSLQAGQGQEARSQEERKRSKVQKQGQEQEVRSEQARGRSKRQEKRKLSRQEAARTSNKRQFWCGDTSLFWRSDGYDLELVSCQFRKRC